MHNNQTLCHSCGKMMVPQVERSRGLYIGWEWGGRFGAGHAIGSICPFCLSADWDGIKRPQPRSPIFKTGLVIALLVLGNVGLEGIESLYRAMGRAETFSSFKPAISLAVIGLLVLLYKRLSKKR
ncbi:hypothetical protein ACV344_29785 [Pseudomonas aeruginosa]|uniref:hypothetical protein n=1 Tax=Pseudomonas aeruginosa TaxID=287 RepID=UPI000F524322|nr:hypothetical protein [Pseudomonas aeruginosa]MBA5106200.1 hypothetical protein [Pseudomonas aeruginosa]MBD1300228.1 hypothetical protein [Pseudomonas aeruginosa]MBD1340789.1 hypothetical protein [Pseudomonas aeruginosa]MBG4604194.1 hypothetical protein [Pseudomonas aeruginosa]MBH3592968.1 hypothetical protein [Pseudomonas aeruginosa]